MAKQVVLVFAVVVVAVVWTASQANGNDEEWCMDVKRGAVLALQPLERPRLGGNFIVYGLEQFLFAVRHIVGPCQPVDPTVKNELCDLLWIEGKLVPSPHVVRTFFVGYTRPLVDASETIVAVTYASQVSSILRSHGNHPGPELLNVKRPRINPLSGVVSKRTISEIFFESMNLAQKKAATGGTGFSIPYKTLVPHPYITPGYYPLTLATRIIFGHSMQSEIAGARNGIGSLYYLETSVTEEVAFKVETNTETTLVMIALIVSSVVLSLVMIGGYTSQLAVNSNSILLAFAALLIILLMLIERLTTTSPSRQSRLLSEYDGSKSGILTDLVSIYKNIGNVPFTKNVTVYKCDSRGAKLQFDEIEIIIPPVAIPQGVIVHVEVGVALYGPFLFATRCHPVSPILWFCTQERIEFQVPVTFKLPHTVIEEKGMTLNFAKASHYEDSWDKFCFKRMRPNEFEKGHMYGALTTKHHCFLCIQAEAQASSQREMSLRKGFCLHIFIKKEDSFTYQIVVVCTYFLPTCFEALKELYPESPDEYECVIKKLFRFKDSSEPFLEIKSFSKDTLELTTVNENVILVSEIDFWNAGHDKVDMELLHREKMYPPKLIIKAHSHTSQYATITLKAKGICVTGISKTSDFTINISKQFGSPQESLTTQVKDCNSTILEEEKHFTILYGTLCKAVASRWDDLGSHLGVDQHHIDVIQTENAKVYGRFREVLKKWLRKMNPPPTKSKILEVLRHLELHEEARQLEMKLLMS